MIDDRELELVWINDLVEAIEQIIGARRAGIHEVRVAGSARLRVSQLRELGCQTGQGFLFARPMDADASMQYLADQLTDGPVQHGAQTDVP